MKYVRTLFEKSNDIEYGCLMLYLGLNNLDWIKTLNSFINRDDLGYDGFLELEPHITILYGFHEDTSIVNKVRNYLSDVDLVELKNDIKLKGLSLFENEQDILKISIESEKLTNLNSLFRDNFEYTNNFPEYKAHISLAYLKKGSGKKYTKDDELLDRLKSLYDDSELYAVYSDKNQKKDIFL